MLSSNGLWLLLEPPQPAGPQSDEDSFGEYEMSISFRGQQTTDGIMVIDGL
jgi:hypothetical protein